MAEIRNTFLKGSMNKDLDERLIPEGQYVDALNIDVETTEGQDAGAAKNKLGNSLVVDLGVLSGRVTTTAQTIGSTEYEAENKIYWIVACDTFDGIYEYDAAFGISTRVLQSNKATPTTASKLNLNKKYPITGINFIKGQDGNDYLYWTDDYNPPRRINISRAKSYAVDDARIDSDIDVIIEPPLFAPSIELKNNQSTAVQDSNNMSEKFLYFSYRFKYVDDQYSSISPFSAVSFLPKSFDYDYGEGNNKSMTNFFNSVNVTFETGNEFVEEIQLLVRDTRNINVSIIDSYNKKDLGISNNASFSVEFNNNKIYAAISNEQVTRLFDNVPLLAKAQDVVGNRLAYGNYVQFRNITNCLGADIAINYNLSILSDSNANTLSPKPTWRSDRDYEIGLVYLDEYGRMTTVLNGVNPTYNSVHIPPANSATANSIKLTIQNQAPCWATHYRVYVKQAKKSYYNIFPIISYYNDSFRYFLINESDLNKFKVGEYVIFKNTAAGPTYSNKKYKVLEIESKEVGFITNAIAGIYFKVKVDDPLELSNQGGQIYTSKGIGGTSVTVGGDNRYTYFSGTFGNYILYPGYGIVDKPVFYGTGDPLGIELSSLQYNNPDKEDTRITIRITSPTKYSVFKNNININATQNTNVLLYTADIVQGVITSIAYGYFSVIFNQSAYNVGDRWVFNCRNAELFYEKNSRFSGDAVAIIPGDDWSLVSPETDRKILKGAIIKIKVEVEQYNDGSGWNDNPQTEMVFDPSPAEYENIEEWWYESGARDKFSYFDTYGTQKNGALVRFRRCYDWILTDGINTQFQSNNVTIPQNQNGAVRMFIFSSVPNNTSGQIGSYINNLYKKSGSDANQSKFQVSFGIEQQENINICETIPVEEDADIYHELLQTYPIVNGYHKVLWAYDDFEFYAGGLTRLRQFNKDVPHYFNVGDSVKVTTTLSPINGIFEVVAVEDLYSVVIDAPFPGAGPAVAGTVSLEGVVDQDQTSASPAIIQINKPNTENSDFNAWCWGNGLESDRIYDDFNETTKGFSPRVQTPIEDYKQIRSEASICYSGVYQNNSSLNRLNEFNLSISNFKYLDRDFGSIQKLYARDTDLVIFQENKVSTVLYGKNILFDSVGGGQVVSVPEVLGTQVPMPGEWGISKNPESFAKWADSVWFTDLRRGSVLQMTSNQIMEISSLGMSDYFRDLMRDNPLTLKLGAYDPHNHMYVLSAVDKLSSASCQLSITPSELVVVKNASTNKLLFKIISNTSWTITLVNDGFGTGWVTNFAASGTGSQDITANISASALAVSRTVYMVVEYCGGEKAQFLLKQQNGILGDVSVFAYSNETPALNQ